MGPRGARTIHASRRCREGCSRDGGVSPVVGMILVLAISVVGVVAVTQWGFPAVQELNSRAALRAVEDEFRDLDATLQQMISGTAGQTTFKWQPAITQGAVDVNGTGDRWFVAADVLPAYQIRWGDMDEVDSTFKLRTNYSVQNYKLKVWRWVDGAATELKVVHTTPCSGAAQAGTLNANTDYTFALGTNTTPCTTVTMDNVVLTFELYNGTTLVHRGALADVGHVHWTSVLSSGGGPSHVYSSNGGLASGTADALLVQSPLALPPPRDFTNSEGKASTSLFARYVKYSGNASFSAVQGGVARHALYLDLVGTYTLGTSENVTRAYVYVWGTLRGAAYDAFQDTVDGYRFVETTDAALGETFLVHQEGLKPFRFTTVYSLVEVEG